MAARREHAHRFVLRNRLYDLAEFGFDLDARLSPFPVNGPCHPAAGVRLPFGRETHHRCIETALIDDAHEQNKPVVEVTPYDLPPT